MNPEDQLGRLLRRAAARSFGAGFADRVMARLATPRPIPLSSGLERHFLRLLPLALAAGAALATMNLRQGGRGQTTIDAVLGLPAVTLAAAYDLGGAP